VNLQVATPVPWGESAKGTVAFRTGRNPIHESA
jgi:hypothetical protein